MTRRKALKRLKDIYAVMDRLPDDVSVGGIQLICTIHGRPGIFLRSGIREAAKAESVALDYGTAGIVFVIVGVLHFTTQDGVVIYQYDP